MADPPTSKRVHSSVREFTAAAAALAIMLATLTVGCGGGSTQSASTTSTPTPQSSAPTPTPTPTTPVCPNPDGGTCLGKLNRGTYKSIRFNPRLTYTVPGGGWTNEEDNPVAFGLAPPGVSLGQAESATDIIIVWPGVQGAGMSCSVTADANAPSAPKPLAQWLAHHKGVVAKAPKPVTVGDLHGYLVSLKIAAHGGIRCGQPFRFVPLFNNLADTQAQFAIGGPATGDHVLVYLLSAQGTTLGIIADSSGNHGPSLAADARVIYQFRFNAAQ